jgi:hypothetical protein
MTALPRRWSILRFRLVHVRPDGSRRDVGSPAQGWTQASYHAAALVMALRTECARGNPEAGGAIAIVNAGSGETVHCLPLRDDALGGP